MPEDRPDDFSDYEENLDFSQDFASEEEANAPEYAMEGIYHFAVQDVDASGEKFPGAVFFVFEILAGNVEGQTGKTVRMPVWPPHPDSKDVDGAKKRWKKTILRIMLAMGLRKQGEFPAFKINTAWWEALVGRQFMARVSHRVRKQTTEGGVDKEWIEPSIKDRDDMFAIGSQEAAGIPINEELALAGGYLQDAATEEI